MKTGSVCHFSVYTVWQEVAAVLLMEGGSGHQCVSCSFRIPCPKVAQVEDRQKVLSWAAAARSAWEMKTARSHTIGQGNSHSTSAKCCVRHSGAAPGCSRWAVGLGSDVSAVKYLFLSAGTMLTVQPLRCANQLLSVPSAPCRMARSALLRSSAQFSSAQLSCAART